MRGASASSYDRSFAMQLQRRIFPHLVINQSVGGGTIPFFEEERTPEAIIAMQPDVCLIMQGSNDIAKDRTLRQVMEDIKKYRDLFNENGIRTVLVTWQPRVRLGAERLLSLMAYNQWLRVWAGPKHELMDIPAKLISLDDPFRIHPVFNSGDDTHFGDEGHREWAQRVDLSTIAAFPPLENVFDAHTGHFVEQDSSRAHGEWGVLSGDGCHGGDGLESSQQGAEATFKYEGRNFCVWSKRCRNYGIMDVILDGRVLAQVDLYGVHREKDPGYDSHPVYCSVGVEPGEHTVTLRVTGKKNPISDGITICADAIEYQPK